MTKTPYETDDGVVIVVNDGRDEGLGVRIAFGDETRPPGSFIGVSLESIQSALEKAGISPLWIPTGPHRRLGRLRPYLNGEITSKPCFRCGRPAAFQWSICADGNIQRPVCAVCDVDLNAHVLEWAGDPDAKAKVEAYTVRVLSGQPSGETAMDEPREVPE